MPTRRAWKRTLVAVGMVAALTVGAAVGVNAQTGEPNSDPGGEGAPRAGAASPTESVFVPITPCRIVNTATSGAGRFSAGQTRAYRTQGNTSSQGGAASCGIPSTASALELNMTAASASGNGYIRVAPAGVAIPNATFMNFTGSFNASNAGTVRVTKGTGNNLQVRVFNNPTHVVIDVLGYYVEELFAVVGANGTLARGNGVVAVNKGSTGIYTVTFNRNVTGCALQASVGTVADLTAPDRTATTALLSDAPNGVWINTYNTAGASADQSFHLTVDC